MKINKVLAIGVGLLFIVLVGTDLYFDRENSKPVTAEQLKTAKTEEKLKPADKIEILNFHSTARCVSCLTISRVTEETLNERFSSELASGKITFTQYNVDLPENKEISQKYQATGTALFMNAIIGQNESFKEYPKVWNYVSNEPAFKDYIEQEINKLLGK